MVFRDCHAGNLRKGRVSIDGQVYLVTTATPDRIPLFLDYRLGRMVVNAMRYQAEKGFVESIAFVVMPDHFHWLFTLSAGRLLPEVMHSVKSFSANGIAAVRGKDAAPTTGGRPLHGIWQRGYHDHALRTEEDVRAVARYVVMNPVRAGIVSTIWGHPLWDAVWVDGD